MAKHEGTKDAKQDQEPMSKVTMRLPTSVLKAAKHLAVDTDEDLQDVVAHALRAFLKSQKGGRS